MFLFKKVEDLQKFLNKKRKSGESIGLVPTMGALHQGHLSLIRQAKKEVDITICSIFVNPTQFNEKSDLDKYPKTIGADIDLLTSVACDVLFFPPVEEVYPSDVDTTLSLDFGHLDNVMEGVFRPGHFEGMAQVVWRLLEIAQPNRLYMGQKDFQQLTIVRDMLKQKASDVELIMCPIVREVDGLAMSSRNVRLLKTHREKATLIFKTLSTIKTDLLSKTPKEWNEWAMNELTQPDFKPEYVDIVDGITLQPIDQFENTSFAVVCTAVWLGEVRLIDNMILKN